MCMDLTALMVAHTCLWLSDGWVVFSKKIYRLFENFKNVSFLSHNKRMFSCGTLYPSYAALQSRAKSFQSNIPFLFLPNYTDSSVFFFHSAFIHPCIHLGCRATAPNSRVAGTNLTPHFKLRSDSGASCVVWGKPQHGRCCNYWRGAKARGLFCIRQVRIWRGIWRNTQWCENVSEHYVLFCPLVQPLAGLAKMESCLLTCYC